jgi:protein-S-isoprenylcysteine O-methyltransferase Ste14
MGLPAISAGIVPEAARQHGSPGQEVKRSMATSSPTDKQPLPASRFTARAIIGFLIYLLLVPALLLVAAGDGTWLMGWTYVALYLGSAIGSRLVALKISPAMLSERARFTQVEGVKTWDRLLVFLVALVGPLATLVVAGLDHRFGWPPRLTTILQLTGLVLVAGGYLLAVWAMLVNEYFSAVVRIQKDRGHRVVTTGPYSAIRHPAYAGGIASTLATPLMLDAMWALIPAALVVLGMIIRTDLEDRVLRHELPGYQEYAAKVRFRLIPGLW